MILEMIFERFYKTSNYGGMGLGLSIAKKIIEAHGGSLIPKSSPGEGTAIAIRLPIKEVYYVNILLAYQSLITMGA